MGLFDWFSDPYWRKASKLPVDKQRELSMVLATYDFALDRVAKGLVGPTFEVIDWLVKNGEMSKTPEQAKSTGLTFRQRRLLINEAMQALVKCETLSEQRLPGLRYLEPKQFYTTIDNLVLADARALAATRSSAGNGPPAVRYSSDPEEALAQLMVRWTSIIELEDRVAQDLMELMRKIEFNLIWKKVAGSSIRGAIDSLTKTPWPDEMVIKKGKWIAKLMRVLGREGTFPIEEIIRVLVDAQPLSAKSAIAHQEDALFHGNIVPGMIMRGNACTVPVDIQRCRYRLTGPKREFHITNIELQALFLIAQARGWSPPPFAVGQSVPATSLASFADILEERNRGDTALRDASKDIVSFCREGGFRVGLLNDARA